MSERESMQYDVVIVGAGPAGLSAAIRLKQLAAGAGRRSCAAARHDRHNVPEVVPTRPG